MTNQPKTLQRNLEECQKEQKAWAERARESENYLQALHYSFTSLVNTLIANPDLLLPTIIDLACIFVDARKGALVEIEKDGQEGVVKAVKGLDPALVLKERYQLEEGLLGKVKKEKKILLIEDIEQDPELKNQVRPQYLTASFIIIPLTIGERLIGLLNITDKAGGKQFTKENVKFLAAFSAPVAAVIENFHLYQKLEKTISQEKEATGREKDTRAALMNMLEDVEEAKNKADEEKNKINTIISNLVDGLLVFDKEGRVSLVNPSAEGLLKFKKEEVIGKSIVELSEFPTLKALFFLTGEEMKAILKKELVLPKDLVLEVSVLPLLKAKERTGSLAILHDITREKKIETLKTEFVSLSAHQLRTPLSAIKWALKMLIDGDVGKLGNEQKEFLKKAYTSNERMIGLVSDLLDITRIEEGRYVYKSQRFQLEDAVESAIGFAAEEMRKKKIAFKFKKPAKPLPSIMMDAEKIKLVIQNLIDNSVKYTPEGGKIEITLTAGKGEIKLSVKDSGAGIPEDQQTRVFTKFFRGANVIRMATEGSGLGLFIVKNIVESHGGKIWFESEEGRGTTFYFTLPSG